MPPSRSEDLFVKESEPMGHFHRLTSFCSVYNGYSGKSLLVAVHFKQRVERLEVGGKVGDVILQEQGVLLGEGGLQPGEHVVAPGEGPGDIRGGDLFMRETQVRVHDAVGSGEVALEEPRAVIHIPRVGGHAAQYIVGGLHDGAHGGLRPRRKAGQLAFKFRKGGAGSFYRRRFIR